MHPLSHYIRQELEGLYSKAEISVLSQLIFEEVCGRSCSGITTCKNTHLSDEERRKTQDIVRRLKNDEPIQYVLGHTEFYGLPFVVTPDVLIPRPETEELVEWVLAENTCDDCTLLDVGTGSGCIAIALGKKIPHRDVHAWDISEDALNVASLNALRNGVDIRFSLRDIFQPVEPCPLFDVIVSNPPYVAMSEKADMERSVIDFEPHEALFVPDEDPLLFYRRIADVAFLLLRGGGKLYFEINRGKGLEVCDLLRGKGFSSVELRKDISGNNRMVRAVKPEEYG